jgi:alpha-beta hydrolase superfamily lysophospholipase
LGFSNVTTSIYPDTRHESLNELNRETVMADFVEWANMAACR